MANVQKVPNAFLEAFRPVLSKIKSRYDYRQFELPDFSGQSMYIIAERYYEEIIEAGVTIDEVKAFGLTVLDGERYAIHPPKTRDYAVSLKKMSRNEFVDTDKYDERLIALFDWLGRRYSSLWHSHESRFAVVDDWQAFLDSFECKTYDVESVIKRIRNSSSHSTYPPSSAEIERYLRISSLNIDIPSASEAFLEISKCKSPEDLPLIVRYARRLFGSYSLRVRTDQSVRRDFISLYNTVVDDYLAGEIDLNKEFSGRVDTKQKGSMDEPVMKKSDLSKLISGM